jgi:hypothetical protein
MRAPLCLLLLTACPGPRDTGNPCAPFLGQDPSVPAAPGEARGGVIRPGTQGEAALFGGIAAEGREGDIKLYNAQVQFIIQGAREGHGYVGTAGDVIDADLVRDDGVLGRDLLEHGYLAFGLSRLAQASTVELLADGSAGGAAHARSVGSDEPWGWFQGMFELDEPAIDAMGLVITTDYHLEPDSSCLQVATRLDNPGDDTLELTPQDGLWASGEDALPWAPGTGLDDAEGDTLPAMVYTGRQGEATLSLWPMEGEYGSSVIAQLAAEYGIALAELATVELGPGESVLFERALCVTPDTATAEAERRRAQGESLADVSGTVLEADGSPVPGVRVHFVDDGGVLGWATTDAEGAFSADLPPGDATAWAVAHAPVEHVQLPEGSGRYAPFAADSVNAAQLEALDGTAPAAPLPFAMGRLSPEPWSFELEEGASATHDFELAPASTLAISLEDGDGQPLPGVVELRWSEGAPPASTVPAELRQAIGIPDGARAGWAWTATGTLEIPALPGTYDLIANHGVRHERARLGALSLSEGETAEATLILDEVVPREGWLAMDSHSHGAPSFDGALPMEDRLVACAATGVDLPLVSDHDVHVDYGPLLEALGLSERAWTTPGVELTTMIRGHFNLFPIVPDPTQAHGGAIPWWLESLDTPSLFERMLDLIGEEGLLQVNHPRTPGMVEFADYDPATGEAEDPDYWSWDFDQIELINGGVDDLHAVRADWFSFLSLGHRPTILGVSDSHYRWIPCGMARTDVFLGRDSPAGLDWDSLRAALQAGHVVAARGTTLRAWVGEALPGDTVTGAVHELDVLVTAPAWIQPGTLRVYRDGAIVHEEALPSEAADGVYFDGSLPMEAEADAWFAVEVEGTVPMGDAWRNQTPYAMSNAFFLDIDDDGWDPPGL